jgi:hypothetical protein
MAGAPFESMKPEGQDMPRKASRNKPAPVCDPTRLCYNGDGTAGAQLYRYSHCDHGLKDVVRPGYFDPARDRGLRPWDEIHYVAGGPEPSDASRGILVVEDIGGGRAPVVVAIVQRYPKATPCRHGGEAVDD